MALNSVVMQKLHELGFGVAVPRLAGLADATLARAAHSERAMVEEGHGWLEAACSSDDTLLVPPQRAFCSDFIVQRWRRALADRATQVSGAALSAATLGRRMARWCAGRADIWEVCIHSAMIGAISEELKVSLLKSTMHGWCSADSCESGTASKKGACRYWTTKRPCPRGPDCPFAHDPIARAPAGSGSKGEEQVGFAESGFAEDAEREGAFYVDPLVAGSAGVKEVCKSDLQGRYKKGDHCA